MSRPGDPRGAAATLRAAAAASALAVLAVLAALVCAHPAGGVPAAGPAAARMSAPGAAPAPAPSAAGTARAAMPGAAGAFAASADGGGRDCDGGAAPGEGGLRPAAPPRGSSAAELLPALHEARSAAAAGCGAAVVTAITPERAPPLLAPPSPQDLSILRV